MMDGGRKKARFLREPSFAAYSQKNGRLERWVYDSFFSGKPQDTFFTGSEV
jgi:hypothetical protein